MERYERIVAYKTQYNSTFVSKSYKADPQLRAWANDQRRNYNTNSSQLTADRIEQLNSIGFSWNTKYTPSTVAIVPDQIVSTNSNTNRDDDDTIDAMDVVAGAAVGINTSTNKKRKSNHYSRDHLKRKKSKNSIQANTDNSAITDDDIYYDNDDNDDPKNEYDDDSDINVVVTTDTTTTKRKESVPNKYEARWNEMYGRLLTYKNKNNGSTSVPYKFDDDPKLEKWVTTQRRCNNTTTKKNKLPAEHKERLNSIDFVWNAAEAKWVEMFNRLIEYKKQFKHTCVPAKYKADLVLAVWVYTQRSNYHKKILTKERFDHLEDLGFQWVSKDDATWNQRLEELRNYMEEHDGQLPTTSTSLCKSKLEIWVLGQRYSPSVRAAHTKESKAKLRSISSLFHY